MIDRRQGLETSSDQPSSGEQAGAPAFSQEVPDLHRLLVETVRDYAIFALDPKGYVMTWNAGAERIKGYRPEDIIGKHFSIFYPADKVAAGFPDYELKVTARTGRFEDEGWRIRKDGTEFWANVVITALHRNGRLVGFAKVTRDLTERRVAEEELRASEERFRMLVDGVRDYAIFMLDRTGRVATWNEGAHRIKGYTAKEIIGQHFSKFYTPEDLATSKPERELAIATRVGKYEEEGWRVRKDGTQFWASVVITALRDASGELVGFGKVTRDLTERRAVEEAQRARQRAEDANRTKSEFLAAMSHELRTPLNAIGGYADLIGMGVDGPVTDAQRDHLERIRKAQQHLLGIINDLLNFSRIEAGQLSYDIERVPLKQVVESVTSMIVPQAALRGIRFEHPVCSESVMLQADRAKAEQIVLNLLSNAVKFTSAGGEIHVTCTTRDHDVVIAVRDTGTGIPASELERIFEPFVQVGRTLSSMREGSGLGLAISRDMARAMHGNITVESAVGRGSTFTLTLPLAT